jgi:predicted PurR-regulated permease PerM
MTLQITIIIILALSLIFVISAYDITTKKLKQTIDDLHGSLTSTQQGFQADLKKLKEDYNNASSDATKFESWYSSATKRAVWAEKGITTIAQIAAETQASKRYKKSNPKYPDAVKAFRDKYINIAYGTKQAGQ